MFLRILHMLLGNALSAVKQCLSGKCVFNCLVCQVLLSVHEGQ
jgi:hypothetical protein